MKVLDLGTGYECDRWLPGADLASQNLDERDVEHGRLRGFLPDEVQIFYQHVSSGDPLPVSDGTYDLVWYSYGLYTNWKSDRKKIADEITRVTKGRATLVLRDYTQWYPDSQEDDLVSVPLQEWVENVEEIFPDWNLDYVAVHVHHKNREVIDFDDGSLGVIVILKKGWG